MIFVLGVMVLKPGEWFLIPANVPHCYIQGELVEIMVNSDNVIRGGLTPKHKDTATLLQLLDFNAKKFEPKQGEELYTGQLAGTSIMEILDLGYPELRVLRIKLAKFVKPKVTGKTRWMVPEPEMVEIGPLPFLGLMVVISGEAKVQTREVVEGKEIKRDYEVAKLTQWYIKPGQLIKIGNRDQVEDLLIFIASPKDTLN